MKDFIEKKIAVTFANRAERIEFLKMCQKAGLMWCGGVFPLDSFATGSGLDGHQIECGFGAKRDKNLTHSTAGCHKNEGWEIVPFSEFDREETIGVIKRNGNTITVHMGDLHGTAKCSPDDQFDLYTGCELALRRALGVQEDEPVYTTIFKPGKRYKVSVRAYKRHRKNVPIWMTENDGKTVEVTSTNTATCGYYTYAPNWCEEIQELEKPAEPEKPKYYNGKVMAVFERGKSDYGLTHGKIYEFVDGRAKNDFETGQICSYAVKSVEELNREFENDPKFIEVKE